jgi:hypothetical protein
VTRRLGHAARAQIVVVVVGQRHHVDARGGQGREPRRRGHEPHPRAPRAGLRRPRHHRRLEVGEREVGGDEQRRDLDERIVGLGGDRREATRHVATEHHVADEGQGERRRRRVEAHRVVADVDPLVGASGGRRQQPRHHDRGGAHATIVHIVGPAVHSPP